MSEEKEGADAQASDVPDTAGLLKLGLAWRTRSDRFPLPFKSVSILRRDEHRPYVIGAMFTDSYRDKARRLAASCQRFGLTYEIHEVPTVHSSISARGSGDARYTKPNFIRYLLGRHRKPILYMDADCEILSPPVLIDKILRSGHDFAIYNWFADEWNERFFPVKLSGERDNRYYRYTGCVPVFSDTQLCCAGLVQFYGNTLATRLLLKRWHRAILNHEGSADDELLDFTFNNLTRLSPIRLLLKPRWLPKSYARIAWWIFDQPVINHSDIPNSTKTFKQLSHPSRQQHYLSLTRRRRKDEHFPIGCIIDTREGRICELVDGYPVVVTKADGPFWL